jgi:hypothetical protein
MPGRRSDPGWCGEPHSDHPLKSELNFTIGNNLGLDFSPPRLDYAIYLLDALFYGARAQPLAHVKCTSNTVRAWCEH